MSSMSKGEFSLAINIRSLHNICWWDNWYEEVIRWIQARFVFALNLIYIVSSKLPQCAYETNA